MASMPISGMLSRVAGKGALAAAVFSWALMVIAEAEPAALPAAFCAARPVFLLGDVRGDVWGFTIGFPWEDWRADCVASHWASNWRWLHEL
jgi:hypothetical protein